MSADIAVASLPTPVAEISVAVTGIGLVAVGWATPERLAARLPLPVVTDPERVRPALTQLGEYFRGARNSFALPIDWQLTRGSTRQVLQTLHASVAFGACVTYGDLAARSGTGVPARGIGAIMGANPIPIVVPCHRVVSHDGLGGFSGGNGRNGLEVKRWLLTLEGALPMTFDWSPDGLGG